MNQEISFSDTKFAKAITPEQIDLIIAAVLDGKYSWACVLILRSYGYDPAQYLPYGTYNRLLKANRRLEQKKTILEKQFKSPQKPLRNSLGLLQKLEKTTDRVKTVQKTLPEKKVYQCQCPACQRPGDSPEKELHSQMNLFLSRLNEQQRRWYVALEAKKLGYSGAKHISQVTGIHTDTIRRGRQELDDFLAERPIARVRQVGGGRKASSK